MTSSVAMANIATVDFSAFSDDAALAQTIGAEMEKTGIMFLSNTGFNHQLISDLWDSAKHFFALPCKVKLKYAMAIPPVPGTGGYLQLGMSSSLGDTDDGNARHLHNDRETFKYFQFLDYVTLPDEEMAPSFIAKHKSFGDEGLDLSLRIMDCLSLWWKKDASDVRTLLFSSIVEGRTNNNLTGGQVNYYGELDENANEGNERFCAHKDRVLFTLLWPTQPGLQIHQGGEWVDVPVPPPGNIILIGATALETITTNKMKALLHRVVVPPGATEPDRRTSTGYFFHPDNDVFMVPLDGDPTGAETFIENKQRVFSVIFRKNDIENHG